jgi:RNA polymerase sigma-70 factor (ECF subfamily)
MLLRSVTVDRQDCRVERGLRFTDGSRAPAVNRPGASVRQEDVPSSDEALLAAVAGGDRAAFRALYDRHAPWLTLRLARRASDPDLVDETVQDTFVAVWRTAARYHGGGEVAAWFGGFGGRRFIYNGRRRPRAATELPAEDAHDATPSAEEQVLLGLEHGDLGGALERLSPELRAVVRATVLDGLTTEEAGRLLGIPAGTVKTRMMRARARLREELA